MVGDQLGRVACAAGSVAHREVDSGDALHNVDYLEHAGAVAIAHVQHRRPAAVAQMPQPLEVGVRNVDNMDEVSDASPIGR